METTSTNRYAIAFPRWVIDGPLFAVTYDEKDDRVRAMGMTHQADHATADGKAAIPSAGLEPYFAVNAKKRQRVHDREALAF